MLLMLPVFLKVPYYEKHIFSGLYIYKPVLPEPTNSQDEMQTVSKSLETVGDKHSC